MPVFCLNYYLNAILGKIVEFVMPAVVDLLNVAVNKILVIPVLQNLVDMIQ